MINEEKISQLRELEKLGSIIFIPNHISYVDFLSLSYVLYAFNIKCPHIDANEDFLNIPLLTRIMRASGTFFIQKQKKDELYVAIVSEYIRNLIWGNHNMEIFIEISRTRSGKLMSANNPVIDIFANSYLNGEYQDKNIHIGKLA